MGWLIPENETFFQKKLKSNYPNCKLVIYFEDIIASRNNRLDLDLIEKYFDLAISYDKKDAENNGLYYYPTFFSHVELDDIQELEKNRSVFYWSCKR